MSPLSESRLDTKHNTFWDFFRTGLMVSLSTDSPVIHHITNEPLLEEYAISAQVCERESERARGWIKVVCTQGETFDSDGWMDG